MAIGIGADFTRRWGEVIGGLFEGKSRFDVRESNPSETRPLALGKIPFQGQPDGAIWRIDFKIDGPAGAKTKQVEMAVGIVSELIVQEDVIDPVMLTVSAVFGVAQDHLVSPRRHFRENHLHLAEESAVVFGFLLRGHIEGVPTRSRVKI